MPSMKQLPSSEAFLQDLMGIVAMAARTLLSILALCVVPVHHQMINQTMNTKESLARETVPPPAFIIAGRKSHSMIGIGIA